MIKRYIFFFFAASILWGCYEEIALPINADFSIVSTNDKFTIPAKITINNSTTGAETFKWTFEGGLPASSTQRNPGEIVYTKPGTYTIKLEANNFDGVQKVVEKKITINDIINVDYSFAIDGDSFAPAVVNFKNNSSGSDTFEWTFEGGNPATSTQVNPRVTFENGGSHKVSLRVFNKQLSVKKDTTIILEPELTPSFAIVVPKRYEELEAPCEISLKNTSIGNTTNTWTVEGSDSPTSKLKEPTIKFSKAGTYTIQLVVGNGKKTKTQTQQITIKNNKGYAYIKDAQLGIFSARNEVGVYYSTLLRKAFIESENISKEDAATIDFVFFGFNQNFTFNKFVSPHQASQVGLIEFEGATKTLIVNNSNILSVSEFEKLDAQSIQKLVIDNTEEESDSHFAEVLPKIILFENSQKKKGVILIKKYVKGIENPYILVDIKITK